MRNYPDVIRVFRVRVIWIVVCLSFIAAVLQVRSAEAASSRFVLSCVPGNDLARVLQENGITISRFDTPLQAVNEAAEGEAVLILADDYPTNTTQIPAAVFE